MWRCMLPMYGKMVVSYIRGTWSRRNHQFVLMSEGSHNHIISYQLCSRILIKAFFLGFLAGKKTQKKTQKNPQKKTQKVSYPRNILKKENEKCHVFEKKILCHFHNNNGNGNGNLGTEIRAWFLAETEVSAMILFVVIQRW